MDRRKPTATTLASSLIALAFTAARGAAVGAVPDQPENWEKYAGIAKKGQNDCGATDGSHVCSAAATVRSRALMQRNSVSLPATARSAPGTRPPFRPTSSAEYPTWMRASNRRRCAGCQVLDPPDLPPAVLRRCHAPRLRRFTRPQVLVAVQVSQRIVIGVAVHAGPVVDVRQAAPDSDQAGAR